MGRIDRDFINKSKYHFRYYRPSKNHPFLVAVLIECKDENGKAFLSGFNMTHSTLKVLANPSDYMKISNPNPDDDSSCYIQIHPIRNKPLKLFSNPIKNWELSKEDEILIDELIQKKL